MNVNYRYRFLVLILSFNSYLHAGPEKRLLNFKTLGNVAKGVKANKPVSESVLKARAEYLKDKQKLLQKSYPDDLMVYKGGQPTYQETFKSGFSTKNQSAKLTDVEKHKRGGTAGSTWLSTSIDASEASSHGTAVYKIRIPRDRLLKSDPSIIHSSASSRISDEDGVYNEKEVSIAHKINPKDIVEVKIDNQVIKNPNFDSTRTGDEGEPKSTILKRFFFGEDN